MSDARVTPKERARVAETCRFGGIARNAQEAYVLLLHCIGIRPQLPAEGTYHDALARLAGLVDPTCHAEPVEGFPGRHRCSVCHTVWQPIEDQHGRYCSNCGCRRTFDA